MSRASFTSLIPFAAFAVLAAVTLSCRPRVGDLCEEKCTCSPCTRYDREQCEAREEETRTKADDAGCSDLYDDYLSCLIENANCHGLVSKADDCTSKRSKLATCADIRTACEKADIHVATCNGIDPPEVDPTFECTGTQECQSQCIVDATCEQLLGIADPTTLNNCFNDCFNGFPDG